MNAAAQNETLPTGEWTSRSPEETFEAGQRVGERLAGGEILLLSGVLGAGKTVFVNPTGNAGLGTAGSGDTLTGVITGFLAQEFGAKGRGRDALACLLAAVYVAGLAGDLAARELGMRTMVASDIRKYLSAAVRALDPEGETP